MLVLALIGVTQFSYGRVFVGRDCGGGAIALILIRQTTLPRRWSSSFQRLPILKRVAHLAESFLDRNRHICSRPRC